jgi:hypothetical protein
MEQKTTRHASYLFPVFLFPGPVGHSSRLIKKVFRKEDLDGRIDFIRFIFGIFHGIHGLRMGMLRGCQPRHGMCACTMRSWLWFAVSFQFLIAAIIYTPWNATEAVIV